MAKPLRNPNRFLKRLQQKSDKRTIEITYLIFGQAGSDSRMILGKGSDGTAFLPAAMHPAGPDGAFVKAGLDEIQIGQHLGNLYVTSDWLRLAVASDPNAVQKTIVIDRMVSAVNSHRA